MTLLDKIDIVLKKYNNGKDNSYSDDMKNMFDMSRTHLNIHIGKTCIVDVKTKESFSLQELIGICILDNNPDLFK